jgi:PD-(D/E)XK nuclease superfamily
VTSLLGRMVRLFPESVPLEDLFTEAVARLFERRPEFCLAWLKDAGLLSSEKATSLQETYVRVWTQRPFAPLEHHDTGSRLDLLIEVHWPFEELVDGGSMADVVILESKIGSGEADGQLRRYAEHLDRMTGMRKTLVYMTRAYDPKKEEEILAGTEGVEFCQLRWHDFYKSLQKMEADALVKEVMAFMEEQGMAKSYRLSTTDLMALSGVPRAFEIFDETFGEEVQAELEAFAGNRINRREPYSLTQIRDNKRYIVLAPLDKGDLYCYASYECRASDGYPMVKV